MDEPESCSPVVRRAEYALSETLGLSVEAAAEVLRVCAARGGFTLTLDRVAAEVLESCRPSSGPDVAGSG